MNKLIASQKPGPQDTIHRRDFYLGILLIVGAMILVYVSFLGDLFQFQPHVYGIRFELIAGGMGLLLLVVIWAWARYRKCLDPFEAPAWISLNVYFQVVLNVWLLQRNELPRVSWVRIQLETIMPLTLILFVVGLGALWAGYTGSYHAISKLRRNYEGGDEINLRYVFIIWMIGWGAWIYAAFAGISSYLGLGDQGGYAWTNYFYFIFILMNTAKIALIIHVIRKPSMPGWIWFTLVILSDIVLSLVNGSKGFALSLLWTIIAMYYAQGRLPKRWILVGLVIIILFVPVVNQYREILIEVNTGKGVDFYNRGQALLSAINETLTLPVRSLINDTSETFQSRQGSLLDISASVLALHPKHMPYLSQEMVKYFSVQLIPRLIWPNKPVERSSLYYITTTYGGTETEYSFSEIGLFADSYRAGGWLLEIVFLSGLAAFLALLYHKGPVANNSPGIVFYIVVITQIIRYEGDMVTTLIRLIQFAPILWLIVFKVMYKKSIVDRIK